MRLRVKLPCGALLFDMSELAILGALAYNGANIPHFVLRPGTALIVEAQHEHIRNGMVICEQVTVPSYDYET